jgi:DMSO/TMAO reductase YedYZ molybdopterin-dependent catalytic subunit
MNRSHLLIGLTVLALLLSACTTATPTPTQAPAATATTALQAPTPASPVILKLEGSGGTKTLTMDDLKALPAVEGWAGIKSSTGKITVPDLYKGVALDELCKLVGGLGPNTGVNLAAKDGYAMTVSYDQITQGDFITYDPGTGDEIKFKDPLTVVIAYEKGGQPLPEDTEGPLKLVVVSAKNNQVVDGHWAVKWINQIAIKSLAQEWKLPLGGAIAEDMDRGTFQSCAAPACHGKTWTDGKAQVWTGVPLWRLAGRVDDDVKHGDGAYNDKLADQGYQVHVVAADGSKVVLESARIKRDDNILVAYLVNGNPLDDKDFPLRLVGSDLQPNEMAGRIAKINLMLGAAQATATPKPTVAATSAPAAAGNAALTIAGAVDKPQTLTMDALKGMQVVKITADRPKQGKQDYEGVRLNALLDQAQVKSSATKLILSSSDGFTTEVTLADARQCADCLLAFNAGKLDAVMPGMQSNFWARDVVKIEVK